MFAASLVGLRRSVSAAAEHLARRPQLIECSEANLCRSRHALSADGSGACADSTVRFSTAISLHDVLLEDETPYIVDERSERAACCSAPAARNWFQRASDTHVVPADITEPASTPTRPEFIQQTPTVSALLTLVEHLSGSLDHEDVTAALEHLLGLTSPDAPQDKSVDVQALRALRTLQGLLRSPMGAAPSASEPRRIDNLRVSQVADLLQALSFARRDGEFARLRNSLVGDLLQHLLHTSEKATAAPASAARSSNAQQLAGRELLRGATPHELAQLADAVSRLAGCMESASSHDQTSPHHHLQCALNVRVAFSAVSAAALRQLEMCAVSPSTCGWDVDGLSGLVTALARLDHYNQALMDAVAVAAVNPGLMATAPPASLALLLSAFARLRHDSPELFRHAALQMRSSMHKLRPKDLAVAINAFESRHVSGTRWRNKPDTSETASSSSRQTSATATPVQPRSEQLSPSASPTLAEYINNPSFFPSVGKPGGTPGRPTVTTSRTRRDVPLDGLNQWDVAAAAPSAGSGMATSAPQAMAVRPMLRMDTKIEPWDLLAGGARKMYLWHLLDVSAAMG